MDEFKNVPLATICESKTNPRKHFDQAALSELAENIKQHGVLSPLLVRERIEETEAAEFQYYEIVFGARRFRAAKLAGLVEVPVRICEMNDQQVLEVQLVENLQRSDVHEIEEAAGYRMLVEKHGYNVAALAQKVNKSVAYIYGRLKLNGLIAEAQKPFLQGAITAGHAILLARLQPPQQKAMLADVDRYAYSVRQLAEHIEREIHRDMKRAPFPTNEHCADCQRRTNNMPDADRRKDHCTDPACYERNVAAFISFRRRQIEESTGGPVFQISERHDYSQRCNVDPDKPSKTPLHSGAWTEIGDKKCGWTRPGIVVDGRDAGHEKQVCLNPRCPVHHPYNATTPQERETRAKELQEQRVKDETRRRVLHELLNKVKAPLDRQNLELLAREAYCRMDHDHKLDLLKFLELEPAVVKQHGYTSRNVESPILERLPKYNDQQLARFLMLVTVLCRSWGHLDQGALSESLKRYRIDAKPIERQVRADLAAKAKAKTAAKPKPKGKVA